MYSAIWFIAGHVRIPYLVGTITAALFLATSTAAALADRRQEFLGGQPPALLNPKLANGSYSLCYSSFATTFSRLTRTPIYSAEHLTADRVGGPGHGLCEQLSR